MDRRQFLKLAPVAAAGVLLLPGCTKAPYTGREQFILVSETQMLAMAQQATKEIKDKEKPSRNEVYLNATREVGGRIAAVADRPDFDWEFNVVDKDDVANAFVLPGGKVFVYTGLFKYAKNRAELAAVIGHEAAHAIARHGAERVTLQLVAQLGYTAAVAAMGEVSGASMQVFNQVYGIGANVGLLLPYSRKHEYEADRIGLIFMAKAGYDPQAAISFWERMSRQDKKKPPEFLSTHPSDSNRIAAIRQFLPEAESYYRNQPDS